MSYIERLSDEEAAWLRRGAHRFVKESGEFSESESEQAVDNLAEFMAASLIFEDALSPHEPLGNKLGK